MIDGDTIRLHGERVRLDGIDAPERDQTCLGGDARFWDCGRAATAHLKALVQGKRIECVRTGTDYYKRALAVCSVEGAGDLGAAMVAAGFALDDDGFSRGRYRAAEMLARAGRRGIWSGQFDTPKHWRATHRSAR